MQHLHEPSLIHKRILEQNLTRVFYFPLIAVPVNLIHVIVFWYGLEESGTNDYFWRLGIIITHLCMMFTAIGMGLIYQAHKRRWLTRDSTFNTLLIAGMSLFMLVGVGVTIIDQLITPAITPFIIFCVAAGVLLLFRPRTMVVFLIVAYGLIFFLLPLTQNDPDILSSNRVNALTAIAIGFIISIILWRNAWAGYKQELIISSQTKELETANRELRTRANQLKNSNTTKDKLMSIIAHDLRSPFNSILGFSSLLTENVTKLSQDDLKKFAGHIHSSASGTLQLLDNLLDWAMIQQDRIIFNPQSLNLYQVVQQVLSVAQETALIKNITLKNSISMDVVINADENMLKTILRNLIGNAVKFSENGGSVEVFALTDPDQITIAVQDTGIGLTANDRVRLFNGLSGTIVTENPNEQGKGLGLILCKEFVERHQGKIWVESNHHKGSTFWFSIPNQFENQMQGD